MSERMADLFWKRQQGKDNSQQRQAPASNLTEAIAAFSDDKRTEQMSDERVPGESPLEWEQRIRQADKAYNYDKNDTRRAMKDRTAALDMQQSVLHDLVSDGPKIPQHSFNLETDKGEVVTYNSNMWSRKGEE